MILLDTNIIIYSKVSTFSFHAEVIQKLQDLALGGKELVICWQVLQEFYKVATVPNTSNGLGLTPTDAMKEVENLCKTYKVLGDQPDMFNLLTVKEQCVFFKFKFKCQIQVQNATSSYLFE